MFFEVDKKVRKKVLNENILNDDFDKFNEKIQDRILRQIHDKDFKAIPIKYDSDNLEYDETHQYMIAKVMKKNLKYDKNIGRMFRKK